MTKSRPFVRACIRKGQITLNRWSPALITGGPAAMQIGRVRASLVDLYVTESDELIAEPVSGSSLGDAEGEMLIEWARSVGYERIWLPDNVVELDANPADVGLARVNCRTCGARWEDASADFWLKVRDNGYFPGSCPACGDSLPEWTVEAATADAQQVA